jgi:single-strand DNA-binding protein
MMKDVNSVTVVGRLVRDGELKYVGNNTPAVFFTIASNRRKKGADGWEDEVNFLDVSLYGNLAAAIHERLVKGAQVCVDGELRQERWTDGGGQNRSRVVINADQCQIFSAPGGSGGGWR